MVKDDRDGVYRRSGVEGQARQDGGVMGKDGQGGWGW
jgi:hypothetical protein